MQRLKLSVIQASLTSIAEVSETRNLEVNSFNEVTGGSSATLTRTLSRASSFNITDPQESFMATISTLITALNQTNSHHSANDLIALVKLFTAVFIKNINIRGLIELFEFEVEDGKSVSELLLSSYINSIVILSKNPGPLLEEVLRSLLILVSSNVYVKDGKEGRYFHEFMTKLSGDQFKEFFDSLLSITCTFTFKNSNFLTGSTPTIPEKSRLAAQLLSALSLLKCSNELLSNFNDLKSFALFIKFQSQFFQATTNFSVGESTILTIFSNFMTNFCSNYRRFLLSKLDNEELVHEINLIALTHYTIFCLDY